MGSESEFRSGDGRESDGVPLIQGVPIRNLWLLMLYASELFRHLGLHKTGAEDAPDDVPRLVAELLVRSVEARLKRNLSAGYQTTEKVLTRVRGKIDFLETRRRQLMERGRIFCRFDEFTVNTPRNRYVRAALDHLAMLLDDKRLAHHCRTLSVSMHRMGVTADCPAPEEIAAIRFGHHDKDDQLMIAAARLAFDAAIPTEFAGDRLQHKLSRDPGWLRRLFENAIAGFYDIVLSQDGWSVRHGRHLNWQIEGSTSGIREMLPRMESDITLEHRTRNRRIVIDTKFTNIITRGRFGNESFKSAYMYQIYAYLRSQEVSSDPVSLATEGILLHPAINTSIDEQVVIQGHPIRFATVDLAAPAPIIRDRLIDIVTTPLVLS